MYRFQPECLAKKSVAKVVDGLSIYSKSRTLTVINTTRCVSFEVALFAQLQLASNKS